MSFHHYQLVVASRCSSLFVTIGASLKGLERVNIILMTMISCPTSQREMDVGGPDGTRSAIIIIIID